MIHDWKEEFAKWCAARGVKPDEVAEIDFVNGKLAEIGGEDSKLVSEPR